MDLPKLSLAADVFLIDDEKEKLERLTRAESKQFIADLKSALKSGKAEGTTISGDNLDDIGSNKFAKFASGTYFLRASKETEKERLSLYSAVFPFFPARVQIRGKTGSRVSLSQEKICKRTGLAQKIVRSDLARLRRKWPVPKTRIQAYLALEKAYTAFRKESMNAPKMPNDLKDLWPALRHSRTMLEPLESVNAARVNMALLSFLMASRISDLSAIFGMAGDNRQAIEFVKETRKATYLNLAPWIEMAETMQKSLSKKT